ncbi:MAG: hypothetical protein PF450_12130 [Bacteroidales bacterium]|jgi:carbamoyltransferase|nr:hypothetical protein [Bacteroidales bacterium]
MKQSTRITLGISAFYHNSAAAFVSSDGRILFAAEEERFSRLKNDSKFPLHSIRAGLKQCGISLSDIGNIIFYEDPYKKISRVIDVLSRYDSLEKTGVLRSTLSNYILNRVCVRDKIKKILDYEFHENIAIDKICYMSHHLSHASAAFYTSSFYKADVLCLDAVGEYETTSMWIGEGKGLSKIHSIKYPHSLGLFYSAITAFLGFKVNHGEYKVMGLAAYGKPRFVPLLMDKVISIDIIKGNILLDMSFFEFELGMQMFSESLASLLGFSPRHPDDEITSDHLDLAASLQSITEHVILFLCKYMQSLTGCNNLALGGGVALNCVANAKITQLTAYKNIWVMPAAGDAGCAIGAACWGLLKESLHKTVYRFDLENAFLGPQIQNKSIELLLKQKKIRYQLLSDDELVVSVARMLSEGMIVGWVNGRMEFGPRALGNRSILADPRSFNMRNKLNRVVKRREDFRPFAPIIKEECFSKWFSGQPNRYMTSVSRIRSEVNEKTHFIFLSGRKYYINAKLPAAIHIDGTSRVQTVTCKSNHRLYMLLDEFEKISGVPVLLNTSFNRSNMPIVCDEIDAFSCFIDSEIDILCLGNYVLKRSDNL